MIIGITGHQRLHDDADWTWVANTLRSALSGISSPLVGISSLAVGADQLFAELVLARGGALHVVLPFPNYADTFHEGAHLEHYRTLLDQATHVEVLPARSTREESYLSAGQRVVDLSDQLWAVWNGGKAEGLGGTGDVVYYAKSIGRPILHIEPVGKIVTRSDNHDSYFL